MAMLSRCGFPGCELLTIGSRCVRHDASRLSPLARERAAGGPNVDGTHGAFALQISRVMRSAEMSPTALYALIVSVCAASAFLLIVRFTVW